MSSTAQVLANRENAQLSTGPVTTEGKSKSSRNATKFGLFSTANCVLPGEQDEYATLCNRLWFELNPLGAMEEASAGEYVRAVWRLRRCAKAEERLGWRTEWAQAEYNEREEVNHPPADPSVYAYTMAEQASIDRARAQARNSMRRAMLELEKLKATRAQRPIADLQIEANQSGAGLWPEAASFTGRDEPAQALDADLQNEPKSVAPPKTLSPRHNPCRCGSGIKTDICVRIDPGFHRAFDAQTQALLTPEESPFAGQPSETLPAPDPAAPAYASPSQSSAPEPYLSQQ